MFSNENSKDIGLLVIRLVIGASMLIFHGQAKLTGGPEVWMKIGANMKMLGIIFLPAFWGFMAAFAEAVCSVLIMLGILFRPASDSTTGLHHAYSGADAHEHVIVGIQA
jgi:putative oxidoreductase